MPRGRLSSPHTSNRKGIRLKEKLCGTMLSASAGKQKRKPAFKNATLTGRLTHLAGKDLRGHLQATLVVLYLATS